MIVRRAAESDVDEILTLLGAVAEEGLWLLTESGADFARRREQFIATMRNERSGMFVAIAEGCVVGEMSVIPEHGGLYGLGMAIHADWRRKGVGSKLMQAGIEWARSMGAHKLVLEVFPHNEAALRLYARFGFEPEGYRPHHFKRSNGELWDVIPMGLLLSRKG